MPKQMNFRNTRSSKRSNTARLPLVVVVLILVAVLGAYLFYRHPASKPKASNGTSTTQTTGAPAADNSSSETRKSSSTPAPTLTSTPTTTPSANVGSITPEIVNASVNNGNLHVGTLVNGTTSGTCTLSADQSGQATLQLGSSSVHQDVNSYDCGVFNIATSKFPDGGNWQLTLTVTSSGSQASSKFTVLIPGSS